MSEENNAAGASGGEQSTALSMDDAVAQMNAGDDRREQAEGNTEGAPTDEPEGGTADHDPSREDEPQTEDDPPETDGEEGEPEDDEGPEREVHGNAKTRLRDGTVVAVADLKKAFAELQDIKRQGDAFATDRQAFDEAKAQVQQRSKQLDELLPHATRIIKDSIPAEPDQSLMESDPIEYFTQQTKRAQAIAEFQKIEGAARAAAEARQKEEAEQFRQYAQGEREKLVQAMPELKDPAKAEAFYKSVIDTAEHYGFAKEDVDQAMDHRLWRLMRDAAAYRKLQSDKPKVMEKAKNAKPVQPAGRRQVPAERRAEGEGAALERLKRTGEFDDALAILNMRS